MSSEARTNAFPSRVWYNLSPAMFVLERLLVVPLESSDSSHSSELPDKPDSVPGSVVSSKSSAMSLFKISPSLSSSA